VRRHDHGAHLLDQPRALDGTHARGDRVSDFGDDADSNFPAAPALAVRARSSRSVLGKSVVVERERHDAAVAKRTFGFLLAERVEDDSFDVLGGIRAAVDFEAVAQSTDDEEFPRT
jgi:hypothetical protein